MRASLWPSWRKIRWAQLHILAHIHSRCLILQSMIHRQCSITWCRWIHHRRNSWSARSYSLSYLLKKNSCRTQSTPQTPSDTRVSSARRRSVWTRCRGHITIAKWRQWLTRSDKSSSRTPALYSRSSVIDHKWWILVERRAKGSARHSDREFPLSAMTISSSSAKSTPSRPTKRNSKTKWIRMRSRAAPSFKCSSFRRTPGKSSSN